MKSNAAKIPISLRVRPEILSWFKTNSSAGYQTAIHAVLEAHVTASIQHKIHLAGRAQEIFNSNHARCFWHYSKSLRITPENIQLVIDGLRKHGGREGFVLAGELCQ